MTDQPTAPPPESVPPPPTPTPGLKKGLTGTLQGFLIASGALLLLGGIARVNEFNKFDAFREGGGIGALEELDDAESLSAGFQGFGFVAGLVVAVLMIIWLYQVYRAASLRGGTGTSWSPGWAVGSWFIPIANLFLPKLVFNETERLTSPEAGQPPVGTNWKGARLLGVGNVWWVLWVVGLVLSVTGFALAEGQLDQDGLVLFDFDADQYSSGLAIGAFGLVVTGVAGFIGSTYVRRLGSRIHG